MFLSADEIAAIPRRRFQASAWRRLGTPRLPESAADLRAEAVARMAMMGAEQLKSVVFAVREIDSRR